MPIRSYASGYPSDSVLCMNSNSFDAYRLTKCPNDSFFSTYQNTSGVCVDTHINGTDLLFSANQMALGLHRFDCLVNNSNIVSTWAIVGKRGCLCLV